MAFTDRLLLRIRHPRSFEVTSPGAEGFGHLRGHKYGLLTTFRKSGEAVPTPIWFGLDDAGRAWVRSEDGVGKIKRIRANPRVLLGPCDVRGKPLGPAAEGRARVLGGDDPEVEHAERSLQRNYGLGRKVYEGVGNKLARLDLVYIEITPAGEGAPADKRP